MTDNGLDAAQAHIHSLPEPRRSHMQHLHDVIRAAVPDAEVRLWDYAGPLIGYGVYTYRTRAGASGEWFPVGLASRKQHISLFSTAMSPEGGYLVEQVHHRFPGTKIGRSCINITKPELVDDAAVRDLAIETFARPDRVGSQG
jgi:hypothetical protein